MNASWDDATASAVGVAWLLAEIAPAGPFGRAARARETIYRRGDEPAARLALRRIAALARELPTQRIERLRTTLAGIPDVRPALRRASAATTLDDVELYQISRLLAAWETIAALASGPAFEPYALAVPDPALRDLLAPGGSPAGSFYLDDAFDAGLASRRAALAAVRAAFDTARSQVVARVASALGRETLEATFSIVRDELPATLPAELRIVREAPTYVVCELVLDDAARDARSDVERAESAVAAAEEAVRARLTAAVARAAPALAAACDALGRLEAALARAAFARRYDCVAPDVLETATIELEDLRYLPLAEALGRHGRTYRPLTLSLAGVGVVTGPNMGGKTVLLRALGFACACVALGVPVPARAAAIPLVDEIVWLGGELRPGDALLSAFGHEVLGVRALLERGASRALVLLDEFGRTTAPREGRALTVALLETLRARGAVGFAATHLDGIATAAGAPHYAFGAPRDVGPRVEPPLALEAALARVASAMDYRLVRLDDSTPVASHALALAALLGLDPGLLARAREIS
ncbi:MAG: hypothetical protein NVSMB21_22280 [Vulcanimicrobiaceae bacterium]